MAEIIAAEALVVMAPPAPFVEKHIPLSIGAKALYASGDMVDGCVAYAIGTFAFFYLTAVCGLSGSLRGGLRQRLERVGISVNRWIPKSAEV